MLRSLSLLGGERAVRGGGDRCSVPNPGCGAAKLLGIALAPLCGTRLAAGAGNDDTAGVKGSTQRLHALPRCPRMLKPLQVAAVGLLLKLSRARAAPSAERPERREHDQNAHGRDYSVCDCYRRPPTRLRSGPAPPPPQRSQHYAARAACMRARTNAPAAAGLVAVLQGGDQDGRMAMMLGIKRAQVAGQTCHGGATGHEGTNKHARCASRAQSNFGK